MKGNNISSTKKSKKLALLFSWWLVQALVVVMENLTPQLHGFLRTSNDELTYVHGCLAVVQTLFLSMFYTTQLILKLNSCDP